MRRLLLTLALITTPAAVVAQSSGGPSRPHVTQPTSSPADSLSVPETVPQRVEALGLSDFEGIALEHNPTLAAAAARLEAARGRQTQAGLYPNPVVGYHATEIGNLGTPGQQGGFISQRLLTAGRLSLGQAIAEKEVDAAHMQFHAQEQRVLSDVRIRFHDTQVAQRRVKLAEQLAGNSSELVDATEKLVEGGQRTVNDLLQAEIRAEEAYIFRDDARNRHVEAWRRLVAAAGVPSMEITLVSREVDVHLPSYDWDGCYAMVLNGNPAALAARARVDQANIVMRRAARKPIPNIDLSVSVRQHHVTGSDVANVQVGIPLPIFNRNQGNIRSAEAEWLAACNELRRIELDLQDRLAVTYRRYANARQQADRYRTRMVPRSQQSLGLVSDGYQKGQVQYVTLLTARQAHLRLNLSYLESLRELWAAANMIEGQLLVDSLAERH